MPTVHKPLYDSCCTVEELADILLRGKDHYPHFG